MIFCLICIYNRLIFFFYLSCATSNQRYMLKAPFRFDIQYFSLLVVFRKSFYDLKHYFKDNNEKKDYLLRIKKQGEKLTSKQLKDIEENNSYFSSIETPSIYLFICNNKNNQLFASVNRYEDLCDQSKQIFSNIFDVYSYLRKFCDSDRVKMTVKGNLLINYEYDGKKEKFKIENYPINFKTYLLDQMWDNIVDSWTNRKDEQYKEDVSFYHSKIEKGTLSLHKNKKQRNKEKNSNPKRNNFMSNHPNRDVEQIQIVDSNSEEERKQIKIKITKEDIKVKPQQESDQQNQKKETGVIQYQSDSSSYRLDNKKQCNSNNIEKHQQKFVSKQNQLISSQQQKDSHIDSYYSSQSIHQIHQKSENSQANKNQQRGENQQNANHQNEQNNEKLKLNISKQISENIIKTIRDEIRTYFQTGPASQKIINSITECIDNKYEHLLLDIKNETKKIINKIQYGNFIKSEPKSKSEGNLRYKDQQLKIQNQKTDKNYNRKDILNEPKTSQDKNLKKNHFSRISQEILSNKSREQRDDLRKTQKHLKRKCEKESDRITNLVLEQPKREQLKKKLISKGDNK